MKTFVILGMHRSATSLAAQGLARSGVNMGNELLGANEDNPYGHWEDVDFIHVNDRILSLAGGSWDDPPPRTEILKLRNGLDKLIRNLIDKKQQEPFWGWKDPRTTLTIELFYPYLVNPHFITCFREPMEVAESLKRRNGFEIEKGLKLAKVYNNRLLEFISRWVND